MKTNPRKQSPSPQRQREAGEILHREGTLEISAREKTDDPKDARRVSVSFSSQTDSIRSPWSGVPEILLHEPKAVSLARLELVGSVLFNHDRDQVIGKPENVTIDEKARVGRSEILFDADAESERILAKVKGGSIRGVSVGFMVNEWQLLMDGQRWQSDGGQNFEGPADIATRWEPFEFSITPTPADATVGVGRTQPGEPSSPKHLEDSMRKSAEPDAQAASGADTGQEQNRSVAVTVGTPPALATVTVAQPARDEAAIRAQAQQEERGRIAGIEQVCSLFREVEGVAVLERELIRDGSDIDAARRQVLDTVAKARQPLGGTARTQVLVDENAKWRDAATDLLRMRAGILRDANAENLERRRNVAKELRCRTLYDLAFECAQRSGTRPDYFNKQQTIIRAVSHTTSDFPFILEAAMNKELLAAFEQTTGTWNALCRRATASDFKLMKRAKLGAFGDLELNKPGQPMAEGSIPDAGSSYAIATYAKRLGLSREAIINDDLDAFNRLPQEMGIAAMRTVNKTFWALIQSASGLGPTMSEDSIAMFSASHTSGSNYTVGASAPPETVAVFGAAKALMRKQKVLVNAREVAPYAAGITPKFLVVPPDLETGARQFIASTVDPAKNNAVPNPFSQAFDILVEPVLELGTNGATAWYLVADPTQWNGVEAAFLDGNDKPTFVREENTNILGVEFGVYLDFGFGVVEHRSWFRHKNAA